MTQNYTFDDITKYFDGKFVDIKRELSAKQPKDKCLTATTLKKKGLQNQLDFNLELYQSVDVIATLAKDTGEIAIIEQCEIIENKIKKRNKLIRIADRSEYGWKTVIEYDQDQLASDDEDNKRIKMAEKEASRKAKSAYKPYYSKNNNRRTPFPTATVSAPPEFGGPATNAGPTRPFFNQLFRDTRYQPYRRSGAASNRAEQQCFACGKFGHYRSDCPHDIYKNDTKFKPGYSASTSTPRA